MLRPTVDRGGAGAAHRPERGVHRGLGGHGHGPQRRREARSTVVEAHIQIDTGMGFGGFLADEPEKDPLGLPQPAQCGRVGHLHPAPRPEKRAEDLAARLGQFHRVVEAIRAAGFETGLSRRRVHYALLHCADARLDGVRAGSALLGRCRRVHGDGLYRVGYGEVGIEETRWLPKGTHGGRARPVVLRRPTRVACRPWAIRTASAWPRPGRRPGRPAAQRWLAARRHRPRQRPAGPHPGGHRCH